MQLLPSPSQAHFLKRLDVSLGEVSGDRMRGDGRGEGEGDREEQSSFLLSTCRVALTNSTSFEHGDTDIVRATAETQTTDAARSGLGRARDVLLATL